MSRNIFILVFFLTFSLVAKNNISLSYSSNSSLFTASDSKYRDQYFRINQVYGVQRLELVYKDCSSLCLNYGIGYGNENISISKYENTSPLYKTILLYNTFTFAKFGLTKDLVKDYLEGGIVANLGIENTVTSNQINTNLQSQSSTHSRFEILGLMRLNFLHIPSIKIESIFLESGGGFYLKKTDTIIYDSESIGPAEQLNFNFLVFLGLGITF